MQLTSTLLTVLLSLTTIVSGIPAPAPIPEADPNAIAAANPETSNDHNVDLTESTANLEARSDSEVHTIFYDESHYRSMFMATVWFSDGCNYQPGMAYRLSSVKVGNGCCSFYSDRSCQNRMWTTCNSGMFSLPYKWNNRMASFKCFNP